MKIIFAILFVAFLGFPFQLQAQLYDDISNDAPLDSKVETSAWYNSELTDYQNTIIPYSWKTNDYENVFFRIPLKFWVYRSSDGAKGTTEQEIKLMITDMNMLHQANKTGFQFYISEIKFVNKSKRMILGYYLEGFFVSWINHDKSCLNVHVVEDIVKFNPFGNESRVKGTYNPVTKAVYLKRVSSRSSLTHEIAHFFGLRHPHLHAEAGKCRQEAVDRTRQFEGCLFKKGLICEHNGDKICDTPAEPNLKNLTNDNCQYIGSSPFILSRTTRTNLKKAGLNDSLMKHLEPLRDQPFDNEANFENALAKILTADEIKTYGKQIVEASKNNDIPKDKWGDVYQPDSRNIMSYTKNRDCRNEFTPGQIGMMIYTMQKQNICAWDAKCYTQVTYKYQYYFDAYEPDNSAAMATLIETDVAQQHTFHKTFRGNKIADSDNDMDWLKFYNDKIQDIEIITSAGQFEKADTEIMLLDNDQKQLAIDDDGNGEGFSKISVKQLPQGWFYILLTKKKSVANPAIGDYTILLRTLEN